MMMNTAGDTMKTYAAKSDVEAQGLREGMITLLVIPMRSQPTDWTTTPDGKLWPAVNRHGICERGKAPYTTGDEIGVKEAWLRIDYDLTEIYQADCDNEQQRIALGCSITGDWQPCQDDSIRTLLLCRSVEARQVQSITEEQAKATGIKSIVYDTGGMDQGGNWIEAPTWVEPFIEEWDRRHPDRLWSGNPWAWMVTVEKKKTKETQNEVASHKGGTEGESDER